MSKSRDKVGTAAAAAAQNAATNRGYEWMTQLAFVTALVLVLTRATIGDFSSSRGEPLGSEVPRAPGAATALGLDLLCCLPAILVVVRRVSDREYVLRWSWSVAPLAALAVWGVLSASWSANKFAALIAGFHLVAATAMLWAALQLVRSWLRLRLVAAIAFGLLLAYFTHSLFFRFIELPDLKARWEKDKRQILAERGLSDDPFLAKQFENRVLAGELMGFFTSPNTMGAMVVVLLVIASGLAVQRILDDKSDWAGIGLLLAIPIGGWMIYYTRSRTAFTTPLLALSMVAAAWRWRPWLAANCRRAFWVSVAVVVLGAAAVIGHGLYHKSLVHPTLTFRWYYWIGAMRIFAHHPFAGVGLNNFGLHYLASRLPEASEEIKDPHNLLVRFLAELGIVGGIACLAWLGRLAWELTRPVVPPAATAQTAPPSNYRGAKAINTLLVISGAALVLNVMTSVDFTADKGYVLNEILHKFCMFALLLIGTSVAAIKSLATPELDARPATLLLYAMLAALAVFVVHNLIDFSFFEAGPMMAFAFLAGSALGVRQPSAAGQKRRTPAAAVSLAADIVLWLIAAGFIWSATAVAEDAANDANAAFRAQRPREAVRLLGQASEHQPLNADYAYRAAQALISTSPDFSREAVALLGNAINANPLAPEYYLTRARYLLRSAEATSQREQIRKDFRRALELNPNEVSIRLEYADALAGFNTPEDKAEAIAQYKDALRYNSLLKPDEPKRLRPEKVAEIERKIQ